jgi:hypothetical protein
VESAGVPISNSSLDAPTTMASALEVSNSGAANALEEDDTAVSRATGSGSEATLVEQDDTGTFSSNRECRTECEYSAIKPGLLR